MLRESYSMLTPEVGRCLLRCFHRGAGRDYSARTAVTLDETLAALKTLQLAGRYYEPSDLFGALRKRLGLDLGMQEIAAEPAVRGMKDNGIRGALLVIPEMGRADLIVPAGLDSEELSDIIYHELAHIVAGHALPCKQPGDERPGLWIPPKRFTRRTPPFDLRICQRDPVIRRRYLAWCEQDADLWAQNLRSCGAYGPTVFFREEKLLGL